MDDYLSTITPALLWRLAIVIGIYVATRLLISGLLRRAGRLLEHRPDRIRAMITTAQRILLLIFALVLAVVLGVDLSSLPAYLGSLLAMIGVAFFAHWSLLSNVTAGVILFASRDLRAGDRIRILNGEESLEGCIVEFRTLSLVLRRDDGLRILCPNTLVMQHCVLCLNHSPESAEMLIRPLDSSAAS